MVTCMDTWCGKRYLHVLCYCSSWCVSEMDVGDLAELGAVVAEQLVPLGLSWGQKSVRWKHVWGNRQIPLDFWECIFVVWLLHVTSHRWFCSFWQEPRKLIRKNGWWGYQFFRTNNVHVHIKNGAIMWYITEGSNHCLMQDRCVLKQLKNLPEKNVYGLYWAFLRKFPKKLPLWDTQYVGVNINCTYELMHHCSIIKRGVYYFLLLFWLQKNAL